MAEPDKPDWGNRIVLIIFGVLALVTIGGTIIATTTEWNAGNFRSNQQTMDGIEQ